MSSRGSCVLSLGYGRHCYGVRGFGQCKPAIQLNRAYCTNQKNTEDQPSKAGSSPSETRETVKLWADVSRKWSRNMVKSVSAAVTYWYGKYEQFVGLNEVRNAQLKVTEAEKSFMVARGLVREAHINLEALQGQLKEVRDRLDRVSREEAHYLELATREHRLLQEERRLRTAYQDAEGAEREKFAMFSAGVRESHEKERSRAERTKNWSIIGSVLGALIGVMGSTYVNRVRLQELRNLLLDAQKGPAGLQEAIKQQAAIHHTQEGQLRGLIDTLSSLLSERRTDNKASKQGPAIPGALESMLKNVLQSSEKTQNLTESLPPQLTLLEQSLSKLLSEIQVVRSSVDTRTVVESSANKAVSEQRVVLDREGVVAGLAGTEKRLEKHINKATVYNTVLTYSVLFVTLPLLYLMLKGT